MIYEIEMIITTKENVRDPEGESIKMYAVDKVDDSVSEVRAGKYLLFRIDAESETEAMEKVKIIADKARLYNPIIHQVKVRSIGR
ncbi:phosphoribosylformylglycinamidine synthase subunit PurS [Sulfuracidifex metallicus]|uniref:phosphoribosylformylglycinamidine synthase subunit PurS n=1 Tax=Sulfuracidifex metallicus TaxID=47303 RepID=UPI0022728786|nr:phosphoribosylformylglycinamidine synthase subunit PurS [Sulfuracidifex metallicus]MCY0849911.1 phosphoribosylformylglycinamidine synthase subunit PurS [Sulfuracidifex metallicus]